MIGLVAVFFCSAASHLAVNLFKIKVYPVGHRQFGPLDLKTIALVHGSSLAFDGLDWNQIAEVFQGGIENWATPGSSPSEWEILQNRSMATERIFVVISPYDLNEFWLCDFRADIVPLGLTLRDLWKTRVDWPHARRILSQYPMMLARKLFPTAGRSDGVMVGIRSWLRRLARRPSSPEAGAAPRFGSAGPSVVEEKVSDWPIDRIQRRMALMRASCLGQHAYAGLKNRALLRLLEEAQEQSQVILVVLPVSPFYHQEFLSSDVMRRFEKALDDIHQQRPGTRLIRLDHLPVLKDNAYFYDFVHLNKFGQAIATRAFFEELKHPETSPSPTSRK